MLERRAVQLPRPAGAGARLGALGDPGHRPQLGEPQTLRGSATGIIVSSVVALYGGLGVGQAFQYAMNTVWGVPRNSRPNPFQARGRSFLLLLTILLFVILTTAISILSARASRLTSRRRPAVAVTVVTFLGTALVFALGMRRAVALDLGLRQVAVGAIGAAGTWQVLQYFGVGLVERAAARRPRPTGCSASSSVSSRSSTSPRSARCSSPRPTSCAANQLYPRALLTPFTDNVDLTDGDRRAYAQQARIGRFKQYQQIDVDFERPIEPVESASRPPSDPAADRLRRQALTWGPRWSS